MGRRSDLLLVGGFIRPMVLLSGLGLGSPVFSRWPVVALISLSGVLVEPIGWFQQILFGRRLRRVLLPRDPVVVIGHWRSGTTFLHQLLACDPSAATARNRLTIAPQVALILKPLIRWVLKRVMTPIRPIDNVTWGMDDPQEDEVGLARLTIQTNMAGLAFPQLYRRLFHQFVLNQSLNFEQKFLEFTRLTWFDDGDGKKHLLIKNAAHSARIPLLLRLFPKARFIFLKRDARDSIRSLVQVKQDLASLVGLQMPLDEVAQVEETLSSYIELIGAFEDSRHLIPRGQLVELSYEQLLESPTESLQQIYRELNITSWEEAREPIAKKVRQSRSYCPRPVVLKENSEQVLNSLLKRL